jgi:diguanylate cyclase (GGDEF)-like protein
VAPLMRVPSFHRSTHPSAVEGWTWLDAKLQEKLERSPTLPTIPAVAVKVLQLCQQEDFDLREIAQALALDPALSTKVLKLANSPMMGIPREVKTVSHAIGLLGVNAVKTLALSFSLVAEMKKQGQDRRLFWKRSLVSAIAARELTRAAGLMAQAEEAFLAGLLQDIGMLALWQVVPDRYVPLLEKAGSDHEQLAALERETFGCDHTEVGAWLLGRWKLPEFLQTAARLSHGLAGAGADADAQIDNLVRSVELSGAIADIWAQSDPARAAERVKDRAATVLDLDHAELEPVLGQVASAMVGDIAKLFDIDSGTPDEVNGILEQAKEALVIMTFQAAQQAEQAALSASNLRAENRALAEGAGRDKLTGLYNRERLESHLSEEFGRAQRMGKPLSILFCDVDHFKGVNDTHGHQAGDQVLSRVAALLTDGMRELDLVARYGGEEFVVILPGTPAAGARVVAERVRKKIEANVCALPSGVDLRVTISIGTATLAPPGGYASKADLVRAADEALYVAKRGGRNRIEEAAAPPAQS